jgi:hypothetical protein
MDFKQDEAGAITGNWSERMKALKEGKTILFSEEEYDNWFDAVPVVNMGANWFIMGEPFKHTDTGIIYSFCWKSNGKHYARNHEVKYRKYQV